MRPCRALPRPGVVLLCGAAVWSSACGDEDPPFAGDYQTISLAENATSCDPPLAPLVIQADEEFFRLQPFELQDIHLIGWYHCTAPRECSDAIDTFNSFGQDDNGEWARGLFYWGGEPCHVMSYRGVISRLTDATILITTIVLEGDVPELGNCSDPDRPTTTEMVEPFLDQLPCTGKTELTARVLD